MSCPNTERPYSMRQVIVQKFFYWMKSDFMIFEYLKDYSHILKPRITGSGIRRRYFFEEENLRAFIEAYEANELKDYEPFVKFLTAKEIHKSGAFYWVSRYVSVVKLVNDFSHLLKPTKSRYSANRKGGRLYVAEESVKKFVELYKRGQLRKQNGELYTHEKPKAN